MPGWLALMIYCGTYWAAAGLLVHGMKLFEPGGRSALVSIFLFAAIWTTLEWFRSYVITGLPWLYLGHTQTPLLAMCQIADTLGAYGVSFAVAAVNAAVFMALIVRPVKRIAPAAIAVGSMLVLFVVYGVFRIEQTATEPGPLVVVTPREPPKAAPMAAPTPAISSSAWTVRTPKCLCLDSSWRMSEAGVIGYDPRNRGRWA